MAHPDLRAAIALAASLLPPSVTLAQSGNLITVSHHSPSLGREATFEVFLPGGEPPAEGWPVLYLLHGAFGGYRDWTQNTNVESIAGAARVMLVLPDGGEFGWYLDSPVEPESQRESYIIRDLIPLVDEGFPTRRDRAGRGICGLSMGGHGAISLATKHPHLFASASSLSGIMVLQNHIDRWELLRRLPDYQTSPEYWEPHSCLTLAPRLVGTDLRLMLDCGDSDLETGATQDNRIYHARLTELGVPHVFHEHPGGHSWEYWGEHIGEHVRWHADGFYGRAGIPPVD